jgi:hypothetical protein
MERKDTWVVKPDDERPARQDGTCFYCGEPIGGKHKSDCVIPQKSVMLDFTIRLPVLVPVSWDKDQIESLYNESSWCCDNLLNYISEWQEKSGRCLCGAVEARYISDANAEEDMNAV